MASGSIFDEAYQKANQKSPNPQIPAPTAEVKDNHELQVAPPPPTGVPGSNSTFGSSYNQNVHYKSGAIYNAQNPQLNQNSTNTTYQNGAIGVPQSFNKSANIHVADNAANAPGGLSNNVPFEAIIPSRSSAVVVSPREHHAANAPAPERSSGSVNHYQNQAKLQNNSTPPQTLDPSALSSVAGAATRATTAAAHGAAAGSAINSTTDAAANGGTLNSEAYPKYVDGSIYSAIDPNLNPQGSYHGSIVTPTANGMDAGNISLNANSNHMSTTPSTNSEGYSLFNFLESKNESTTPSYTTSTSTSAHDLFNQTFNANNFAPGVLINEVGLVIMLAVIIEMFIPISRRFKVEGLSNIFKGLGRKVNRSSDGSTQRALAGILLPSLILTILFVLIFTLDAMSGFDKIVALVVLIFILDLKYPQDQSVLVYRALNEGFKEKAKELLEPMVLRECHMLSSMGIAKACCEATILRIFSGWFSVIVWYFIAGIEGALLMQTIVVLSRTYNYKLRGNYQFGRFIFRLHQIAVFIPACFLMIMLMFSRHPLRHFNAVADGWKNYPAPVSGMALAAVGAALDISLGGPRYYQGNVMRLNKLGGANAPDKDSILKAMRKVRMCGLILLVIAIILGLNI